MKILLLGPYKTDLILFLRSLGDDVFHTQEKIDSKFIIECRYDFIISYGYRFIITKEVVQFYKNKIINLHISFLPWNKGADPNIWSFIDNTPKGVSIHYMDEEIDTGDIIEQKEVEMLDDETLASSYQKLSIEIENLFRVTWPLIKKGENNRLNQKGRGTYHLTSEKNKYEKYLTDGWNTPVKDLLHGIKEDLKNGTNKYTQ